MSFWPFKPARLPVSFLSPDVLSLLLDATLQCAFLISDNHECQVLDSNLQQSAVLVRPSVVNGGIYLRVTRCPVESPVSCAQGRNAS